MTKPTIHERVLITLSCGHTTMGEHICATCVAYYESVPCDLCCTGDEPDPPDCECIRSMTLLLDKETT